MRIIVGVVLALFVAFTSVVAFALLDRARWEPVYLSHWGVCVQAPSQFGIEASEGLITVSNNRGAWIQIRVGRNAMLSDRELEVASQSPGEIVASPDAPSEFVATDSGNTLRMIMHDVTSDNLVLVAVRFCDDPT